MDFHCIRIQSPALQQTSWKDDCPMPHPHHSPWRHGTSRCILHAWRGLDEARSMTMLATDSPRQGGLLSPATSEVGPFGPHFPRSVAAEG
jgi:hypothetical protein